MERTDKELLEIMLACLEANDPEFLDDDGLCTYSTELTKKTIITLSEEIRLDEIVRDNTPPESKRYNKSFFWKPGNIAPRIRFVERLIIKYDENNS